MKAQRHAAILEIIEEQNIENQEQLGQHLARRGLKVTQATLSRDIRELGLAKVADVEGAYYALPGSIPVPSPQLEQLMPSLLISVDGVDHLLVLRTAAGAAQALASAIDREAPEEIVGSIAGDDTILLVVRSEAARRSLARRFKQIAALA